MRFHIKSTVGRPDLLVSKEILGKTFEEVRELRRKFLYARKNIFPALILVLLNAWNSYTHFFENKTAWVVFDLSAAGLGAYYLTTSVRTYYQYRKVEWEQVLLDNLYEPGAHK